MIFSTDFILTRIYSFFDQFVRGIYLFFLILYIISPLDIIPECIFGVFGLIDDLIVLCIIFGIILFSKKS